MNSSPQDLAVGKSPLQSLARLKTLHVHCYSPPVKEDLVLALNDDCLIHVLSFLQSNDWLALSQAHPRFEGLVVTNIYGRKEILIERESFEGFSQQEKNALQNSLLKHATSVKVRKSLGLKPELTLDRFENLQSISWGIPASYDFIRTIPNGVKKLHLNISYDKNPNQLIDLFRRLSPTLTSLSLEGSFKSSYLSELRSLRELKVAHWNTTGLVEILRQNGDHLERLEINFDIGYDTVGFTLCPLKKLKVLHLTNVRSRIDLNHSDFPSLEDLQVTFHRLDTSTQSDIRDSIFQFVQLKSLSIYTEKEVDVEKLFLLKNLEILEMYVNEKSLLLEQLPKLAKLNFYYQYIDFETKGELRRFLIAEKRMLWFCGDDFVLP